jgi:uncharacterized protein YeaO (DUF488 family)
MEAVPTTILEGTSETVQSHRAMARAGEITFVYAAKDEQHNSALVLKEFLDRK